MCFYKIVNFVLLPVCIASVCVNATLTHKGHNMTLQRLKALRALMSREPQSLAAYIVPTADAHNSEYIAPIDARREWLSGFTGSAGTAVVTATKALVWTDGRYYTQFEKEVDLTVWSLMKQSLPDTLSIEKWLAANLTEGAVVGVDPHTTTRDLWTPIETTLTKASMKLIPVYKNLVDLARVELNDPPPPRPRNDVEPLNKTYTGKTAGDKIKALREKMLEKKASLLVITALDEVAYTLNLRGSDIEFNPVFFSYLIIAPKYVKLFWADGNLAENVKSHLEEEGVKNYQGLPYGSVIEDLQDIAKCLSESGDGKHSIWLASDASEAIHRAVSGSEVLKKPLTLISEVSPVALAKLVKNEIEIEGFRQCHIRDGVAVTRLFKWLHDKVDAGVEVSEIQVADKLLQFRKDEKDFKGPSFETIAGAGENGAIIHYAPSRDGEQRIVRNTDMFLLDSGGQYRDGTTDITRTRHMGAPSAEQKDAFTRVLKGQMMLGSALFPKGVKGNVLDSFARKCLWDVGLDYAHGTGHGVGHFLNVHEGPSGVSWRPYPNDPGLEPRQVLSNEPGYYKVGEYGIRHEDLVEIIQVTKDSDHPKAKTLKSDYDGRGVLGFNTMTLVPHHADCIDVAMLDDFELEYLNAYHGRVLKVIGGVLKERGLMADYFWLETQCRPLTRG